MSSISFFTNGYCKNCKLPIRPVCDIKTRIEYSGHSEQQRQRCGEELYAKLLKAMTT